MCTAHGGHASRAVLLEDVLRGHLHTPRCVVAYLCPDELIAFRHRFPNEDARPAGHAVFFSETGATSNRLLFLAKGLQAAGHEVVVVAEKPNHPEGVIREGYRGGPFTERTIEGLPAVYIWVYTRSEDRYGKTLFERLRHWGLNERLPISSAGGVQSLRSGC